MIKKHIINISGIGVNIIVSARRRKLLRSLTPGRRKILHMWDPEIVAMKQRALVQRVYGRFIMYTLYLEWPGRLLSLTSNIYHGRDSGHEAASSGTESIRSVYNTHPVFNAGGHNFKFNG